MFYLNEYTWIFGEEDLDQIGMPDFVEVCFQSSLWVGKTHLQHGCDHAAGRDVVSGKNQAAAREFLYGSKCVLEVFGIGHGGSLISNLVEGLCKSRSSQLEWIEREIDIIEVSTLDVSQYWRDNPADVLYLRSCRDDDRARREDFVVSVFLSHGK